MILQNGKLLREDSPERTEKNARRWHLNQAANDQTAYSEDGRMSLEFKVKLHQKRAPGDLTVAAWVAICEFFGGCAYCGQKIPATSCTLEHVIPVSRGGKTDVRNVVSSCWRCNKTKYDRDVRRFLGWRAEAFLERHAECTRKVMGE